MSSQGPPRCPKCKGAENLSVRLQPSAKVPSRKIQRLLKRRQAGDKIKGKYNQNCVSRYSQHCNTLVLRCSKCDWFSKRPGQSREQRMQQKLQLLTADLTNTDTEPNCLEESAPTQALDSKSRKKLKKKERKKTAKVKRDGEQKQSLIHEERGSSFTHPLSASALSSAPAPLRSGSSQGTSPLPVPISTGLNGNRSCTSKRQPPPSPAPQVVRKDTNFQKASSHSAGRRKGGLHKQHLKQLLQEDKSRTRTAQQSLANFLQSLQ